MSVRLAQARKALGNTIRNRDALHAPASVEGPLSNTGDAITNRNARQALAVSEGFISDASDCFAFNDRRYN